MSSSTRDPTLLEMVRNVIVTYKGTVGDPVSLADISKIARVEPITLVSSSLTGVKELYYILHGILNIYAAFYLQAVHILSAELVDIRILKILDKTNPDRDLKTLLTAGYTAYESLNNVRTLSLEDCKYKLPMLESDNSYIALDGYVELKSGVVIPDKYEKDNSIKGKIKDNDNNNNKSSSSDNDRNYRIRDYDSDSGETSLSVSARKLDAFDKISTAVGKVIEVKFNVRGKDGKTVNEVSIPVVVRLDTMVIPSDVLDQILITNKDQITLGSRFKDAITGRIHFIKDFILCSDLIKAQKRTMIKDPTGYYTQLMKRINKSRLYSALSGNISLAGISSIIILSEENEHLVQRQIGGKLTNQTTREIIFNNTSAMMLVVIDREWERVSIYIRDIDGFSQNSYDDFKPMSDKNLNNIAEIFKALTLNSPPSF